MECRKVFDFVQASWVLIRQKILEKNNKIEMIKLNKETSNLEIMKECNILYPQIQSHKRVNT